MAEHSTIEWTDATWNPITGCSIVSHGCTNCYAMKLAGTRLQHHPSRAGLTSPSKAGPVWNGKVRLNEEWLMQPLAWTRPRRIFVCAHGDLFAEGVPDAWIDTVFGVMASAGRHTFQVLTKRPARARQYLLALQAEAPERLQHYIDVTMAPGRAARQALVPPMDEPPPPTPELRALYDRACGAMKERGIRNRGRDRAMFRHLPECHWRPWPLPNVWLGVSAEDQVRADERVPDLLATPAAVRFVSAEPLLGPIDFMRVTLPGVTSPFDALRGTTWSTDVRTGKRWNHTTDKPRLDWIIVGGESGPGARAMHPAWARSIRDQCAAAGTSFFMKQWGAWGPIEHSDEADEAGWQGRGDWMLLTQDGDLDLPDGRWPDDGAGEAAVVRVGKKAAGRLLDGVEHSAMPERCP